MALTRKQQKIHAAMAALSAILWLFALVPMIIMFINFMSKRKKYNLKQKAPLRLATAIFIMMIIAAVNSIFCRTHKALRYSHAIPWTDESDREEMTSSLATAFLIITFGLIVYTFVLRLKYVFSGTSYDYHACFYIFMYVEIITMLIAAFAGDLLKMTFIKGFALLMFIFNCVFLTYLFGHSLKKIMSSNSTRNGSVAKVMVKFVVLLSIAMSSSLIYGIAIIGEGIANDTDAEEPFTYMSWIIQPIDSAINIAAIYFQFKFTDNHYFKFLRKYHEWIGITFFAAPTSNELQMRKDISKETIKTGSPDTSVTTTAAVTTTATTVDVSIR